MLFLLSLYNLSFRGNFMTKKLFFIMLVSFGSIYSTRQSLELAFDLAIADRDEVRQRVLQEAMNEEAERQRILAEEAREAAEARREAVKIQMIADEMQLRFAIIQAFFTQQDELVLQKPWLSALKLRDLVAARVAGCCTPPAQTSSFPALAGVSPESIHRKRNRSDDSTSELSDSGVRSSRTGRRAPRPLTFDNEVLNTPVYSVSSDDLDLLNATLPDFSMDDDEAGSPVSSIHADSDRQDTPVEWIFGQNQNQ